MPENGDYGNKTQDALLKRMQQGGMSRSEAIATAKDKGWIKQKNDQLVLTDKGKQHAKEAKQDLKSPDKTGGKYKYTGDKWTKAKSDSKQKQSKSAPKKQTQSKPAPGKQAQTKKAAAPKKQKKQ